MATLRERKINRKAILQAVYDASQGSRVPGVSGAKLRDGLQVPDQDLADACTYLTDEGLIAVDWTTHKTPAMVTLTHRGIRLMEAQEEERG
jgi:hypothetical protein